MTSDETPDNGTIKIMLLFEIRLHAIVISYVEQNPHPHYVHYACLRSICGQLAWEVELDGSATCQPVFLWEVIGVCNNFANQTGYYNLSHSSVPKIRVPTWDSTSLYSNQSVGTNSSRPPFYLHGEKALAQFSVANWPADAYHQWDMTVNSIIQT